MKNSSSGEPSPFSSSTHDPNLSGQPTQNQPAPNQPTPNTGASNLPDSVQKIMAANARGTTGSGPAIIASSYKQSGKVGSTALPVMLIASVVGALITAAVYFFIAPYFNVVLITQLYLGAILGAALWIGVKAGKVRSQRYSSFFAVLGTLILFGAYHAARVQREREATLDFYAPTLAKSTKTSLATTRARLEQKFTYTLATRLYCKDLYTNGVTLQDTDKTNASSTATHLTGMAYVAFLLAEIGMTALAAAIVASIATTARFSESQNRWYSKKRVFAVSNKEVWPVLQALRAGEWASARQIATERKWKVADVGQVYVSTVPGDPNGWVEMTLTQDKQQKLLFESEVNADALRALGAKI